MTEKQTILRISDIARLAGVSTGTVDRVLHNRGRVSADKREKVETILREMDYKPNPLARSLASRRQFRIITLTPEFQAGQYWEQVNSGIQKAAASLDAYNILIEQQYFDQYNYTSFVNSGERLIADLPDAVVIATLFEQETRELTARLDQHNIPYVFIDADLEKCNHVAFFGTDSYQSGRVAASLILAGNNPEPTLLSILYKGCNGILSLQSRRRQQGFLDFLAQNEYQGKHTTLVLDPTETEENKRQIQDALTEYPISGITVFNSRINDVIGALPATQTGKIRLIGYDLIEANKKALEAGEITWLIGQRPEIQGYEGVKTLSNLLLLGEAPATYPAMPIDILMRENIGCYHNFML